MKITGFNQILIKGKTHNLSKLRAQIIEQECDRVGDTIKLGEVKVNVYDLMNQEYRVYGKVFKGTVEEIKKQVTRHLETMELKLSPGSGVWLGDNYVISQPNETFSETMARLIANEIRKVEEALI